MRVFKGIGLGILLLVGLLASVDRALAQQGTDSVLTNAIQSGRMTVLEVNAATGQIHCVEADGRLRVVEFPNGVPMVVSNGVQRADLGLLSAGDLIKVQRPTDGQAYTIVVLRRGSDEIASPEH